MLASEWRALPSNLTWYLRLLMIRKDFARSVAGIILVGHSMHLWALKLMKISEQNNL